jgi:hypothetical protein
VCHLSRAAEKQKEKVCVAVAFYKQAITNAVETAKENLRPNLTLAILLLLSCGEDGSSCISARNRQFPARKRQNPLGISVTPPSETPFPTPELAIPTPENAFPGWKNGFPRPRNLHFRGRKKRLRQDKKGILPASGIVGCMSPRTVRTDKHIKPA